MKIDKRDGIQDVFRKYYKMNLFYNQLSDILPNEFFQLEVDFLNRSIKVSSASDYFKSAYYDYLRDASLNCL